MYKHQQPRRGAALIIALVLLFVIGAIASTVLVQILRDRQEARLDLIRQQAVLLCGDALRIAEVKREADPEFSGYAIILGPDQQPFPGIFRITTQYQSDRLVAEVEYRNEKDKVMCVVKRE